MWSKVSAPKSSRPRSCVNLMSLNKFQRYRKTVKDWSMVHNNYVFKQIIYIYISFIINILIYVCTLNTLRFEEVFSLNSQLHNMGLCNRFTIAIHLTNPFIYENSFLLIDLTWLGLEKNQLQSHINIWQQICCFLSNTILRLACNQNFN